MKMDTAFFSYEKQIFMVNNNEKDCWCRFHHMIDSNFIPFIYLFLLQFLWLIVGVEYLSLPFNFGAYLRVDKCCSSETYAKKPTDDVV